MNPRHNSKTLVDALQSREGTCDGDRVSAVGAQIDIIGIVPISIAQRVRKVFLSNNNLQNLRQIPQFRHCETLSLTHNDIKYLEDLYPLKELTSLKKLSLEGNLVTKLPFYRDFVLGHCENITHLDQWRITDEDRVRATVNYRRACVFISRAITNAVRNALLGSMVTKRLLHNEMRSSVFARHRSLQASFIASASPTVTSLSKLVSFLKHCGIFRDILMKCEAHMSRELQHALLKIQLSHLQESRHSHYKVHASPLSDDELFDKYFAQQELYYEHFLQENESVELFLGVSQAQDVCDTQGDKAGQFDLVTSEITQDASRANVAGCVSKTQTTTHGVKTSVATPVTSSSNNNKQVAETAAEDSLFRQKDNRDRELLHQQYRNILNSTSLSRHTASKDQDTNYLQVNEKENNAHHNHHINNVRERKVTKHSISNNDNDDRDTHDTVNNSSINLNPNVGMIKATIKTDSSHTENCMNNKNSDRFVANKNHGDTSEPVNIRTQSAPSERGVSPSVIARNKIPLPMPPVTQDVSQQAQMGTQVANLEAFLQELTSEINREETETDDNEEVSQEVCPGQSNGNKRKTRLLTQALDALQVCHESRHSVLTQTLSSLQEELESETSFLSSTEDTVSQPPYVGDAASLTELKRKIQLLSKKLILLQRHETQLCSRHKHLRHTVTQLSNKDSANSSNYYHNLEAVSSLVSQNTQLKQQVSQATSYVSLCDADIALYHALQKKRVSLTEQTQRDAACVAQCQQEIEHETAATQVLRRDVSRVSETLSNVSHAVEKQKLRQRVQAVSQYDSVVRCVSLMRKTFEVFKRRVFLLKKIRNFQRRIVSRHRFALLSRVVSQWKKIVDTVSRGHALQTRRDAVLKRRTFYKMRVKLFRQKLRDTRVAKLQFLFLRRRFRLWRSVFESRQCVTGGSRVSRKVLQDTCVAVFTVLRTFRSWKRYVRNARDTRNEQCVLPVTQRRLRVCFAQWIVSRHIRENQRKTFVSQIHFTQKMKWQQRAFQFWHSVWRRRVVFETLAMKKKHFRRFMKRIFQLKKARKSNDRLCVTKIAVSRAVWQVCRDVFRKNNVSRALKVWHKFCVATRSSKQLLRFVSWRHKDVSRQKYLGLWRQKCLRQLVHHTATQVIQMKRLRHLLRQWCRVATQQALSRVSQNSLCPETLVSDANNITCVADTFSVCHISVPTETLCVAEQQSQIREDRDTLRHVYLAWREWAVKSKRLRHSAFIVSSRHASLRVSRSCRTAWLKWCRAVSRRFRENLKHQFHVHATLALYVRDTTGTHTGSRSVETVSTKIDKSINNDFIKINSNSNMDNDNDITNKMSNTKIIDNSCDVVDNGEDKLTDIDNIDDIIRDLRLYEKSCVTGGVARVTELEEKDGKCVVDRVLRNHSQYMATCDTVCRKWRARHVSATEEAETLVLRVATYCDTISRLETQRDAIVASVTHWNSLCDLTQRDLDALTQCVSEIERRISCRDTPNEQDVSQQQLIEAETRLSALQLQQQSTVNNKTNNAQFDLQSDNNNRVISDKNGTNSEKTEEENDETLVLLRQQLTSLYYRCDTVTAQRDTLTHRQAELRHQYEELCLDRDRLTHLLLQAQQALSHATAHLATQMAQQETQLDTLQQEATQQRHIITLCREEESNLRRLLLRLQQNQDTDEHDTPLRSICDNVYDTSRHSRERGGEIEEAQMRGMAMALLSTSSVDSVAPHRDTGIQHAANINNDTVSRGGGSVSVVGEDETSLSFATSSHQNVAHVTQFNSNNCDTFNDTAVDTNNGANVIGGFRNEAGSGSVSIIAPQGSVVSETSSNNFSDDPVTDTRHSAVDRDIAVLSQRLHQRFQSFASSERL